MEVIALLLACAGADKDVPANTPDDSAAADTGDTGDTADTDTGDSAETGTQPADADGDGIFTPDDCDDADPSVYPGATDWCDGVDQDCDGDPVGSGMCGEWGTLADLETLYWVGEEPGQWFTGGYFGTLDGQPLMGAIIVDNTEGVFAEVLYSGLPDETHRWSDQTVGLWRGRAGVTEVNSLVHAGDFDGDGWDDLWVWTGDRDWPRTDFRLQLGPSTTWPSEGIYGDEVDDGVWYETDDDNETLSSAGDGRDIDGDGLADVVHGAPRGVTILFGRTDVAGEHDLLDEAWIAEDDGEGALRAYIASDMDGDGARELVLRGPGDGEILPWLDGATLRELSGAPRTAVQQSLPVASGGVALGYNLNTSPDVGDLDGDGVADLLAQVGSVESPEGEPACLAWLSSAAIPTAAWLEDTVLARACWYGDAEESEVYAGYGDIDDDGVLDPRFSIYDQQTYYDRGWSRVTCSFGTSRLELGGTIDAAEVSPCYYGLGLAVPDLDGDGRADYMGYNLEWLDADTEDYGRTDILLGFDIPWDDVTKW